MSVHPDKPPPPPAYQPPTQQGPSTVILTNQPTPCVVQRFHETPVSTRCPFCQANIVTTTFYETGTFTWVACFIIFIIGCYLGCCLFPFCMSSCKDCVHHCPNCTQQVGRYNRM